MSPLIQLHEKSPYPGETCLESSRTSTMDLFAKTVNGF